MIFNLKLPFLLPIFLLLFLSVKAHAAPTTLTFQSKIYKPSGAPLDAASVSFRFSTLDPTGTCILFVEDFANVDMQSSFGLAIFSLGSGTRVFPVAAFTYPNLFNNLQPSFNCQGGGVYTPNVAHTDSRKIILQFNDATGTGWQTLPAVDITSVPYSNYAGDAEKLAGFLASDFLRTTTLPTCGAGTALSYNGTTISCVAAGGGGGSGTVTSVSVASANGFTGSVATATTTPAITISTSVTGLLKGNGTAISAAAPSDFPTLNQNTTGTAVNLTGTVAAINGGTGQTGFAVGDLLYASAATALSKLAATTSGYVLTSNGAGTAPSWQVAAGGLPAAAGTAAAPGYAFSGNTNTGMFGAAVDILGFSTGGAEKMRIDASGKVGVGTTSPQFKLSVSGTGTGNSIGLEDTSVGAGTPGRNWRFLNSAGLLTMHYADSTGMVFNQPALTLDGGTVGVGIAPTAVLHARSPASANGFTFKTTNGANDDTFVVRDDGNVGIGTTSPGTKLHVNGNILSSSINTDALGINGPPTYMLDLDINAAGTYSSSSVGAASPITSRGIRIRNSSAADNSVLSGLILETVNSVPNSQKAYFGVTAITSGYSPAIVLGQQTGASSYQERMRIDSSGNVGIGTTSPGTKLDVSGAIVSRAYNAGAAITFDLLNGNIQYTTANCGALALTNMQDGGSYQIIVQGATSGTCTFTHAGLAFRFYPANAPSTAATHTIYSMTRAGTNVYVTWITGI